MCKKNPWEEIRLSDYEDHMQWDSVLQLQTLNAIMKEQFESYSVKTVMILGVAGGNGLEHVDTGKIQKVYGVDINREYLESCRKRYDHLGDRLECLCADLCNPEEELSHAELMAANLVIEYIGYECFETIIRKTAPTYVSVAIQVNAGENFVSDSPYLHVFDRLDSVHETIREEKLLTVMKGLHYRLLKRKDYTLPDGGTTGSLAGRPGGKKLVKMDFVQVKKEADKNEN